MKEIIFLASLFFYSVIAIYQLWLVCHYNGKIIFYYLFTLRGFITTEENIQIKKPYSLYDGVSMAAICVTGLMPVALLSITTATLSQCFNSVYATALLELALTLLYLFIPTVVKRQFDLFGIQVIKQHSTVILYGLLWCLSFAFWATLNHKVNLDYMISNTNPDMWAYVQRIAAFTTDKLSFYGGSDSFTFIDHSACAFLLGSPKKFSSFLGSLISYPFQGSSLGIAVFQSTLGGTLLICLFREWMDVRCPKTQGMSVERLLLMAWVLSSPPLYWLMVSSYFSNALFVMITALTFREARQLAIANKVDTPESLVFFFSILTIVFSFYPAFIPIIILVFIGTIGIYVPFRDSARTRGIILKLIFIIIGCGILFCLLFSSQLNFQEVRKSLNFTKEHGSNFVPLNPWSLLQEKPKPMASAKDFGLYINVIIGLVFSSFIGWNLLHLYRSSKKRDLAAGLVGVGIYSSYLLAHIPLESTYRLMKIAISIIYPLAIFGLLPLLLWGRKQLASKPTWIYRVVMLVAVLHVVLHIHKTFDLRSFPSGSFTVSNASQLENIRSIAVVGCKGVHKSQFYERLVGLQLARRHPNLIVNVFRSADDLEVSLKADLVVYGKVIADQTENTHTCHFSI